MGSIHSIAVFCGSREGANPAYAAAATAMGGELARRGIRTVFGGGRIGLMGKLADAALAAGGEVVGVIPKALLDVELAHPGVARMEVVTTMHQRKNLMFELSDAFVALPGGFGTLEELMEMLTWTQLRFHSKPCGLINVGGFYSDLLAHVDRAVREGFMTSGHRDLLAVTTTVPEMMKRLGIHMS